MLIRKYDGALGVLGALEVIQTLIEKNKIEESIGLAVFTNEEFAIEKAIFLHHFQFWNYLH